MKTPLFPSGRIVATPGAVEALARSMQTPMEFLDRHFRGDWGDIHPDDEGANEQSLKDDTRLLSVYRTKLGTTLWIITEADRSATTILLPEEY